MTGDAPVRARWWVGTNDDLFVLFRDDPPTKALRTGSEIHAELNALETENAALRDERDEARTAHEGLVHVDQDELEALREKAKLTDEIRRAWDQWRPTGAVMDLTYWAERYDALTPPDPQKGGD